MDNTTEEEKRLMYMAAMVASWPNNAADNVPTVPCLSADKHLLVLTAAASRVRYGISVTFIMVLAADVKAVLPKNILADPISPTELNLWCIFDDGSVTPAYSYDSKYGDERVSLVDCPLSSFATNQLWIRNQRLRVTRTANQCFMVAPTTTRLGTNRQNLLKDQIFYHSKQQQYVPLKQVNVEAYIKSFAADVTIKQVFRNDETKPIEAVYCFPIEEQAAIYSFIARIDDQEIIAQLKEKKEAQREYSDVIRQGDGAYLLEQDEKSQDNFIINVGTLLPASSHANIIVAVEQGAVMASFIPTKEDCQRTMNNMKTTNEFMFVIDCSGSMRDENKIELVRQAMLLFLKSLPMDCYFNIIRFETNHETLFKEITAVYNEQNAQKAKKFINYLQADLGGTELLRPLQWLEQHSPEEGRARQIFLLTDGEISNVNEVLNLCRSMATSTRIFSFGLGHSPSRSLVKGLARATNGRFVFIPPKTSVDVHVGEQLQKALQSSITNVQVEWNLGTNVMSAPTKIPPVYANDRLIVYALTNDPMIVFDHNSNVKLHTNKNLI
ncbi:unnamed protein product [Rotaria sordida]|uniref:VWFA domain-containing protein n=1 Tax=Rotaria sordida TaxID=392033 RepID=A0A819MXU6_9BILA|nr:unnamed protein product [Rotaria sordida]CAF3987989.1 unnamed protein product [Rotaria sordida]